MQKTVQAQTPEQPSKNIPKVLNSLEKYVKQQRTFSHQYQIVKQMLSLLSKKLPYIFQTFKMLYLSLSPQIKDTILFCQLNYVIWNDQSFSFQIRQKTQFFKIVSEWIVLYELKVGDLKNTSKQIQFLQQFFEKQTKNIFQKVVLFDEISEDLIELLGRKFWGLQQLQLEVQQKPQSTKEQAASFLKFVSTLIEYESLLQSQTQSIVHHCQFHLLREKSQNYKQFIFRSLQFVLNVNNNNKAAQKCLQKHQQMQLIRIALIFLQRADIMPKRVTKLLKLIMLKTAKAVRYAMVIDFVRYYDYLQKSRQYEILEQLQNMIYFRQLVIGQTQVTQSALFYNPMSSQSVSVMIPSRQRHRILLSHQPQLFGKNLILQLQFIIEAGDITVTIYYVKNHKQTQYWRQQRSQDRRVDILLKEEGLYIIQFDNGYSWVKGKKISYRIQQYCSGLQTTNFMKKQ